MSPVPISNGTCSAVLSQLKSCQPGVSLIRNPTPFQRSRDSSIQDGKLRFGNFINNYMCTFFNDRIQFLQRLKLRHTSMYIQVNAYAII